MVFTDPPYGVDYAEKNRYLNGISFANRSEIPVLNDDITDYQLFFTSFLNAFKTHLSDYNTFYISMSGKTLICLLLALNECEYKMAQIIVWAKNNHVLGRSDYANKHELIVYGWLNHHKFYGQFDTTVWEIDKPLKSELHPTMKPIELIEKGILNSSLPNMNVLDGFGGSGSTLIACEKTDRNCFMMELDPIYCSVIIERWEEYTGQKAVKAENENS